MNRIIVYIIVLIFTAIGSINAQQLPIDPEVRTGTLPNGLTYYIRPGTKLKGVADFYLAYRVGSIVEEDHENGLAHFLEHMVFQGTDNFEGKKLRNYLESAGLQFGRNFNATTYVDKTIYGITDAPVTNKEMFNNYLLILHDWIGGLSLTDEAIEKERYVIREEMRQYNDGNFRIKQSVYNQLMGGTPYAERNVIGTEEVIMNFNPDVLREFYKKWYRPDLATIVVTGDVDIQETEERIKTLFSSLTVPQNAPERIYPHIEKNNQPLIAIAADKEYPYSAVIIEYTYPAADKEMRGTPNELMMDYVHTIGMLMTNNRLKECEEETDAPLYDSFADLDSYMNTGSIEAFMCAALIKDNKYEHAVKSLFRETERIRRFGFTAEEFNEAKQQFLALVEERANSRDNSSYAQRCIEHFLTGAYLTGNDIEYDVYESLTEQLPLEQFNNYYADLFNAENRVLKLTISQTGSILLPTTDQCRQWLEEVEGETLVAYQKTTISRPLMSTPPTGGKIVSETFDEEFGATVFTLSNGVKAVFRQTDYHKDKVVMKATGPGGSSCFPESDPVNIALYNELCNIGGLGEFSNRELNSILAGKSVEVNPVINTISEGFTGSFNIQDLELMMQLVYLHFTAPRTDEEAFLSAIQRKKAELENQKGNFFAAVKDSLRKTVYKNQLRHHSLQPEDLSKADYHKIMEWRKERYADASDFTFVFSGDISAEQAKSLVAQYLGSLPATHRNESYKEINDGYRTGHIRNVFTRELTAPRSISISIYSAMLNYNPTDIMKAEVLASLLQNIYTEKIRMEDGNVYSISSEAIMENYPFGLLQLQVNYVSQPGKEERINEIIHQQLIKITQQGPEKDHLMTIKEMMTKRHQTNEQQDEYWAEIIANYYTTGYNGHSNYTEILNSLSEDDIKEVAARILKTGNRIEVVLKGVEN